MVGNGWQPYEMDVKQGPFKNLDWIHPDDWVKVPQQLLPVGHKNKD